MPAAAAPDDGQWDPTLPKIVSSGAPGDPLAIANASLQASQPRPRRPRMDLGRSSCPASGSAAAAAKAPSLPGGRVRGPQAIEYVDPSRRIADGRAVLVGRRHARPAPSTGVDDDAGKVGFDCSGFTRYAFAGVGVLIPKYSGDQYNTGRKCRRPRPSAAT